MSKERRRRIYVDGAFYLKLVKQAEDQDKTVDQYVDELTTKIPTKNLIHS